MSESCRSQPLPLSLPLCGSQLIEASAGTGKTWTIAALYVRLVIGHGHGSSQDNLPRLPSEILVMTFTRAATRELSDRIRRRLVEAAACFRGDEGAEADDFLEALLSGYPPGPQRQLAAWRLSMAAEAMDDAAVHTIDAWCQRMLREHAFDSGCLFDEELQAHEATMRVEAVHDYWRQHVYPLQGDVLAQALARWKDATALERDVRPLLDKSLPRDAGQGTLADAAARAAATRADALRALKAGWLQRADQMLDWLVPIWTGTDLAARKTLPAEAHARRWIDALKAWARDPDSQRPDVKTGEQRLSASDIAKRLAALGIVVDLPDCFYAFETLMAQVQTLPEPGPALRLHAAANVVARMQILKAQAGTFGFADMLDRLDAALDPAVQGDRALRLRERIVAQYPVALIDEFQDTSPVQLRIFDRLYRIADNDLSRALLLIGDPKQAIYGFRGADIYSYLSARRDTEGRHHVLDTNHRSTRALVQAVNALFQAAETRPGEGAFMFRHGEASSPLPFVPVQARGRAERLVTSQGDLAAITLAVDETLRSKDHSLRLFAALCAERIVVLLNDPQAGFVQGGDGGEESNGHQPFRRLQPADIAVLVRTAKDAEAVRRELRRRGVASVYLSDKDTVFQTLEALDLLRLLQAVASPRDVRLARAALATTLLGFTLPELLALASDGARFDRHAELLQELNQVWKAHGVLAMVRRALHAFGLPARWLAQDEAAGHGERRLTNVLHLAELLQAASAQAEGEQALVRWLRQQIAAGDQGLAGGDELVLRLESDADLVKVVTVHKSKGLEYPLVFLPFPAHLRDVSGGFGGAKDAVLMLPGAADAAGDLTARELVISPTAEQLAVADKERLREDLRLLYVAVTRARHALWVGLSGLQMGLGKTYRWHDSAIGCLLSGAAVQPPEQRLHDVRALARDQPGVVVDAVPDSESLPLPRVTALQRRGVAPPLAPSPAYTAKFERNWSVSSYSALVRDASWATSATGNVHDVLRDDEPDQADPLIGPQRPTQQPWHRFPRGALAGNFLHDQLEWLAGEGFGLDDSGELQERLARRCERQGWGHRADDVVAWLRRVCATPLPVPGSPLSRLGTVVAEMEFWLPSDGLRAEHVDALCVRHIQPGRPRPELPERALKGLLMGFADLVFEHDGRYWVLDYKSNALGPRDGDYTAQAMDAAMLEHRYDVQATLYLLALHRLLRSRLGQAYSPARHLGGAIYFFLRGVNSATAGCCAVAAPLALIAELDAVLPRGDFSPGQEAA